MRSSAIEFIQARQQRKDIVDFRPGDTVRVYWTVKEGEKEREQPFEGVVIRRKRGGDKATFTVRKVSYGVGVERIFPLHSPRYSKIEILSRGQVHRSRLFYLRDRKGKASRIEHQDDRASSSAKADKAQQNQQAAKAAAEKAEAQA